MYIYIHTDIHLYIFKYIYTYINIFTYINYMCLYISIHTFIHTIIVVPAMTASLLTSRDPIHCTTSRHTCCFREDIHACKYIFIYIYI